MKSALLVLAFGAWCCAPVLAQTTSPPPSPMNQGPSGTQPAMPANAPTQGDSMMAPSQISPASANLTGQAIYNAKGRKIGAVSAMTTDMKGQPAATVTMEKYLGMGGQAVAIPVSSLQARASGGYTTNLSAAELKSLAKSGAMHTP